MTLGLSLQVLPIDTPARAKNFFGHIQTIIKMSFPVHLKIKKQSKMLNILRAGKYPIEEPNIIHNASLIICEGNHCSLLWINRETFNITPPVDTSESLNHDARDSV